MSPNVELLQERLDTLEMHVAELLALVEEMRTAQERREVEEKLAMSRPSPRHRSDVR